MKKLVATSVGLLCSLVLSSSVSASLFVADLVDGSGSLPIPGNQAWTGQLGDDFNTTSTIKITSIGVFDDDGDGTSGDLVWQLFNVETGALVHQETVAATGSRTPGSTIEDNYIFQTLATPLVLAAGQTYSAVAYGFDSIDKNFNTNFDLAGLDVVFSTEGLVAAGGRYSASPSASLPTIGAGNSASTQDYNFGAATFEYAVVPEASSLIVWSCILLTGVGLAWYRGSLQAPVANS
ncbi:hypothetical protein NG895_17610 [Aeoliella sp. ICT_H6.2]|uniref:Secreted protein with PEP-CTERM sorting signal n=1 Tax=Aeoliella straminimaris TaxID=2954799 RepID=A0A9X2JIH4_9BACT|nr:hypothetical protein [Aeoliella straminimaris]MCO6045718.1 hypothetical protein [Aeoliella straminimaris]